MIIRSISLKGVSGAETPAAVSVNEGTTRVVLDPRLAASLPAVLMTLLYPEEVSTTDIARLAGPRPDSAWRAEFESEGVNFRVSRSLSPETIVLDIRSGEEWAREATGAGDVRRKLGDLVKLPPPTVMEALNFWINVNGKNFDEPEDSAPGESDELMLIETHDYFGSMAASGQANQPAPISDGERQIIADEYRKTLTIEFVEDQLTHAQERVEDLINRIGDVVDGSGRLAQIDRELSRLPALRELSADERHVLEGGDVQLHELERRLELVDAELADAERSEGSGPTPIWQNYVFDVGVIATIILSALSIFGGPEARRFAIGNVAAMGLALAGFLQWLGGRESRGRSGRKVGTMARRREALIEQYDIFRATLDRVREDLPVSTITEYEAIATRRAELEVLLADVRREHEAAFETPEYHRLAAKKQRAEGKLDMLRIARKRLGESNVSSYELSHSLERAGVDPFVVLWRPDPPPVELKRRVKRLGQVASKYRLINEDGLNPKTVASWLRVAERIVGRELPALNLTPEHQMVTPDGLDALDSLDASTAIAVVEALRMSLHLTLVKANAPGIHRFAIDCHPGRLADREIRQRLDKMYKGLGERLQVVVFSSEA